MSMNKRGDSRKMGKALQEVMQYSNEDIAKIKKHWIIFLKTAISCVTKILVVVLICIKEGTIVQQIGDMVNGWFSFISFRINDYIFQVIFLLLAFSVVKSFVKTYIEYKTVSLSINNIQIKGKTGLVDIGIVNASLEQIDYVKVISPLFGRLFGYGNIEITLSGRSFVLLNMMNAEEFQDAIVTMQEAQKEGRAIRDSERHAKTIQAQTMAQVQAISSLSHSLSAELPRGKDKNIEKKEEGKIKEKG